MIGLLNQNNVINKWYDLFKLIHKNKCISYINEHWHSLLNIEFPFSLKNLMILKDCEFNDVMNKLINKNFIIPKKTKIYLQDIEKFFLKIESIRLVYINGEFSTEFSSKILEPLKINVVDTNKYFVPIKPDFFLNLIESLSSKYTEIKIPQNTVLSYPLYFLYINIGKKNEELNNIYCRKHLEISQGSKLNIIENYISLDDKTHFTGSRFTINLKDNSHLIYTKILQENDNSFHVSCNDIKLSNNNYLKSLNFLLGNNVIFHKNNTRFNGKNSEATINSLSLPKNKNFFNINSYLEHNFKNCRSYQIHKIITMNKAKSKFDGIIKVSKKATKTDAKLTNNNLLLNIMSRVYTKPQLEIYSSDVKCGHGATIGCIDNEQIFYLRSRGIEKLLAQQMIIFAFSYELTQGIDNIQLKTNILDIINKRLEKDKNNAVRN